LWSGCTGRMLRKDVHDLRLIVDVHKPRLIVNVNDSQKGEMKSDGAIIRCGRTSHHPSRLSCQASQCVQLEQGGACSFTNSAAANLLVTSRNKPTDDLRTEGSQGHRKRTGINLDDEKSHSDRNEDLGIKGATALPETAPRLDVALRHPTNERTPRHSNRRLHSRLLLCLSTRRLAAARSPNARMTCSASASPRLHRNSSLEAYCLTSICLTLPTPR
jgi:hypothetical protein